MAITCRVLLDGVALYPELPIDYESVPMVEDRRQLNGALRRAFREEKLRATMRLTGATEAEFTAWASVANYAVSMPFVDERGNTFTVVLQNWRFPLSRTQPDTEGGLNTSGAGYWDLEITVEEV